MALYAKIKTIRKVFVMQKKRLLERFENYTKALQNIEDTQNCILKEGLNNIYAMALIQAYEIIFELSWKTLKNYLEYNGIKTDTPREVIKEAFANNLIDNGQIWIEMMEARNKTSHTYDKVFAKSLANDILNNYIVEFVKLAEDIEGKLND